MFRSAKSLEGYTVRATDGDVGSVTQFYFDEDTWTVRYLVVRTGKWLLGRQVLVSPIPLQAIDDQRRIVHINIKRWLVGNSPIVNIRQPVPREYEARYYRHYGWPVYWGGRGRWGDELTPSHLFTVGPLNQAPSSPEELRRDTNLRSSGETKGFRLAARDGIAGTVEDFILDDQSWAVRYAVVDLSPVAPGRKTLVSPHWIDNVIVPERMVLIDVPLVDIKNAPPYSPGQSLTQDYELSLFKYYGAEREIDAIPVGKRALASF